MNWIKCRLGDVITLQRGHDLPESNRKDGDIPVVSSSGITGFHNEAKAKAPGVITGRYGTIGEVFFLDRDYWPLNTALYVIDFKGNDPRFISFFLKNTLKDYQSDKAAVPGVNRNVLHDMQIIFPDKTTQEIISDILSSYELLVENNNRRILLLEEYIVQIYREWFLRLRLPWEHQSQFIGTLPKDWEIGKVASFYDTSSGGTPSRKNPEYFTGEIPWVKTQELSNCFITETNEKITEDAIKNSSAKLFPSRTVLVALYGATVGELGILALPAATNQACCAILPKSPQAHYIYAYLFFKENKERLVNLSSGAAQKNISQQIIRDVEMIMPSSLVMKAFIDIAEPVFEQILNLQRTNEKLQAARDLLLPRLMSGEIPV